jgi:hypothetical protein
VNEPVVQEADNDAGLAGHRRVDSVAREEIAEDRVFAIRRHTANLVAWVEVAKND